MDEQQLWDMYFVSVAGWVFHPGNTSTMIEHLEDCHTLANLMLEERNKKWPQSSEA